MPPRKLSLSTGQTLSMVATAVVVAVLTVGMTVTWLTLRGSAIDGAQDRMTRGVRQLARVSATGVRQSQPRYHAVTQEPAILRALAASATTTDLAKARDALEKLQFVLGQVAGHGEVAKRVQYGWKGVATS